MIDPKRIEELNDFTILAPVAGDTYYYDMDENTFQEAMEGFEDEVFYKGYLKQRTIGFDAYQTEIKEQFKQISSAEELNYIVSEWNYDENEFVLSQVIDHPMCDLIMAKNMYWLLEPTYFYEEYGGLEACPRSDINFDEAQLLIKIEQKVQQNQFAQGLIEQELDSMAVSLMEEFDLEQPPFNKIPLALRTL